MIVASPQFAGEAQISTRSWKFEPQSSPRSLGAIHRNARGRRRDVLRSRHLHDSVKRLAIYADMNFLILLLVSDVRPKQRCRTILSAAAYGHVFVGLDRAERIQQLADQHGEPSRRGHEEMHGADIAVFTSSAAHPVLNGKRDIGRLTSRIYHMRIGAGPRDIHKRA